MWLKLLIERLTLKDKTRELTPKAFLNKDIGGGGGLMNITTIVRCIIKFSCLRQNSSAKL